MFDHIPDESFSKLSPTRIPTLPGKPGILSFIFPDLENVWDLIKKCEKPGILTQNLEEKKHAICKFSVSRFTFQDVIYKTNSDLHLCHIDIININTDSKPN